MAVENKSPDEIKYSGEIFWDWMAEQALGIPKSPVGYTFHAGDLFHYGHLHQLLECRKYCLTLIVGVLTDQAIASYKRMPIIPYPWRAAIYEELSCVNRVVAQDSRDPTDNLKNIKPDILFHGDDWPDIPGSEWMEANGGKVIATPYFYGIDTSSIIAECRRRESIV